MVKKFIRNMQSKSYELDLIPVTFLKKYLYDFVLLLSLIVTKSPEDACF